MGLPSRRRKWWRSHAGRAAGGLIAYPQAQPPGQAAPTRGRRITRRRLLACAVPVLLIAAPGGPGEPAAPGAIAPPVRRKTAPPQLSLYLPIPLGVPGVDDPATGAFIPDHYRVSKAIDLLVFLRGYDVKRRRRRPAWPRRGRRTVNTPGPRAGPRRPPPSQSR